jgi:uncharacterized protein DUF6896
LRGGAPARLPPQDRTPEPLPAPGHPPQRPRELADERTASGRQHQGDDADHRKQRHTVHVAPDDQAAIDAVRRYAEALKQIRSRLLEDYPQFQNVLDLMRAVRSGPEPRLPREGRSRTGIEYSVHGIGCRMTDERGQEVDVDLIGIDATEAFDGWRIKNFLDEDSDEGVPVEQLLRACAYLAGLSELREVQPGRWYALPSIARQGNG